MTYDERAELFDADLAAAIAAHDSDHALIALLSRPRLDGAERVLIIAALGESGTGSDGSAAVRAQFSHAMSELATATKHTQVNWRDNACAAVIALARRDGAAATDVYLAAIASANPTVHDYGLDALAVEGDRGWNSIVAFISEILSRKTISATRWRDLIKEKRGHPTYTHTRPATRLEAYGQASSLTARPPTQSTFPGCTPQPPGGCPATSRRLAPPVHSTRSHRHLATLCR
jgi:hypothetical protein